MAAESCLLLSFFPRAWLRSSFDSREQDFFAELERDFILELVDFRTSHFPLMDSDGALGTSATRASAIDRGVYLLLGTRRGCAQGGGWPPSSTEWGTELGGVNPTSRPK